MKTVLELLDRMRQLENNIDSLDEAIANVTQRLDELQVQREIAQGELDCLRRDAAKIVLVNPPEGVLSIAEVLASERVTDQLPKPGRPKKTSNTPPPAVAAVVRAIGSADASNRDAPAALGMTVADVAERLRISRHAASVRLQTAKKMGLVYSIGRGRYAASASTAKSRRADGSADPTETRSRPSDEEEVNMKKQ